MANILKTSVIALCAATFLTACDDKEQAAAVDTETTEAAETAAAPETAPVEEEAEVAAEKVEEAADSVADAASAAVDDAAAAVDQAATDVSEAAGDLADNAQAAVNDGVEAASEGATAMAESASNALDEGTQAAENAAGDAANALNEAGNQLAQAANDGAAAVSNAVSGEEQPGETRMVADNPEAMIPADAALREHQVAALALADSEDGPRYAGIWAQEANMCSTVGADGEQPSLLVIGPDSMSFDFTNCPYTAGAAGADSFSGKSTCTAEGEPLELDLQVSVDAKNSMTFKPYADRDAQTYVKCWMPK
jgi:hypothetical protein